VEEVCSWINELFHSAECCEKIRAANIDGEKLLTWEPSKLVSFVCQSDYQMSIFAKALTSLLNTSSNYNIGLILISTYNLYKFKGVKTVQYERKVQIGGEEKTHSIENVLVIQLRIQNYFTSRLQPLKRQSQLPENDWLNGENSEKLRNRFVISQQLQENLQEARSNLLGPDKTISTEDELTTTGDILDVASLGRFEKDKNNPFYKNPVPW